jgi:hypothetical protein
MSERNKLSAYERCIVREWSLTHAIERGKRRAVKTIISEAAQLANFVMDSSSADVLTLANPKAAKRQVNKDAGVD